MPLPKRTTRFRRAKLAVEARVDVDVEAERGAGADADDGGFASMLSTGANTDSETKSRVEGDGEKSIDE
jgi:hypothetical protein